MIIGLQILLFFRESLFRVLNTLLQPYYKKLNLTFKENVSEDEDSDDQVFAEFDDEKGVIFYPRMYVQRYAAVSDCLMDERWNGQLEKVVDFGYHDMSFIKYLKEVPGIKHVLGVDIETIPLQCSSLILGCDEHTRENPLKVTLFQGNAADPDYRLIGCDAVIAIEMIEHMLPHDLERFVHTVFGFIKPRIVILTTPNADFNILFKALENNGLRRLDHFFEWSRSQFNDWCSNIVDRYPNYTVTCKGIGPGPPDTLRLGCCSQLALFVAKVYHKQNDLDLNSLAVVACTDVPRPTSLSDMTCSFDCIPDSSMLCLTDGLNCSTLQVNKFSKTTQSLIAKNKIDSLAYTREVVDEIKHLTRMLNFNKDGCGQRNGCVWHNFNWGENAPYWNQYYKVVRDYSHPFEIKSEESLILDAISEEINLLIDSDNVQYALDVDKFEIPIAHLMEVVKHITNDTNKVKDLLEWNGYQVVDDVLIHSRLVVDTISAGLEEDEWLDNDTLSDNATYVGRSIIKYESYARSCRKTRILPASWTA
ncbi:unnamed protein product [Leptidea sinapis]|uniref:Small RNA 2'-O-methyltransferase n=1 Tax=Leptidea sinapis TaxID=189913 RepID=A0A5E4QV17_9NEOP|nr:unnamed protein product [Leptidea sinapis]